MKQFKIDLWSRGRRDHQQAYRDTAFRLEEMLPPRDVADELVRLYLTTFETTYRILHVPTFLKQYEACWSGGQLDVIFIAKLLALMAASSCFCSQTTKVNGKDSLHEAASAWIMAVQSWVASVFVIESIDFSMLQIQCLLLIACQATCADGDITWISAGSLVRSAMGMGLHRDTSRISHISKFWAEMRRRLWATICELELELSLDAGMTPSIDLDECDCGQPSDWDDEDLSENMVDDPVPKDFGQLSSNSIQTMLSRSLPVRFRIVKLISRLKFSLAYDEALRLTEELVQSMNEVLSVFGDSATGPARIDGRTFTRSFLIFLQRKYLLILHQPFFLNVSCSPKFSYSRKLCVESSMEMLSQLSHSSPDRPAPRLEGLGGGILRDELFRAATTLCVEMALQAEESHRSILSPSGGSNYMGPLTEMTRAQQSVMMQAVERTISIFRGLVGPRGKGSRAYIFLTMAVASVKARLTGEDPLRKVEEASVQVIQECKELMGMRVETRPGSSEVGFQSFS